MKQQLGDARTLFQLLKQFLHQSEWGCYTNCVQGEQIGYKGAAQINEPPFVTQYKITPVGRTAYLRRPSFAIRAR